MQRKTVLIGVAAITVGVLVFTAYYGFGVRPSPADPANLSFVELPPGFQIDTYVDDLGGSSAAYPGPNPGPRLLATHDNTVFVSIPNQGRIAALPDENGDGRADRIVTVVDGLNRPHGYAWHQGFLYVAEEDMVSRYTYTDLSVDSATREELVALPTGGHWTRTIRVFNNSLLVSVGSSCNVCRESNPKRAAITKCGLDGSNCTQFATGLRNAVSFVQHPETGEIYATDNGRDRLGPDTPPEEINNVEQGKNYGWPICYGDQIHDTAFDKNTYVRDPCLDTEPPVVEMQAHMAPLGLRFNQDTFTEEYHGDLFVALHGSWDRREPVGYKVMRIPFENGEFSEPVDFATGWIDGSTVHGRPVDVIFHQDALYITDDNAGKIYRVTYTE